HIRALPSSPTRRSSDLLRLERHATDRAGAGTDLPDLGMHRAGVDRAFRHGHGGACGLVQIAGGIGGELRSAAGRAEIEGAAMVLDRKSTRLNSSHVAIS